MMIRSLFVPLLGLLAIGCAEKPTPIPMQLHGAPFAQLHDVQLGISLKQLAHNRQLTQTSDDEYQERTPAFDVVYQMKDDELDVVSVEQAHLNGTAGLLQFKRYQQEAFRSLGVQPQCRYQPQRREFIAQYPLQGEVYEVSFQTGDPDQASILSRSFRRTPSVGWDTAEPQTCVR